MKNLDRVNELKKLFCAPLPEVEILERVFTSKK